MNMKNQVNQQQLITFIGLILFGTIGRYVLFGMGVQPFPNFEVIMVVTFLAVMLIRSPLALIVPLISMIGSDLLIGNPIFVGDQMNRIVLFTYSGFAIIGLLNLLNKNRLWSSLGQFRLKSVGLIAGLGIGSVLLYDIWTNMGWWYLMYPHDVSSLSHGVHCRLTVHGVSSHLRDRHVLCDRTSCSFSMLRRKKTRCISARSS